MHSLRTSIYFMSSDNSFPVISTLNVLQYNYVCMSKCHIMIIKYLQVPLV